MPEATMARKDIGKVASEVTRAKRRAAFIANIRNASRVDVAAAPARQPARPAAPPAARPAVPTKAAAVVPRPPTAPAARAERQPPARRTDERQAREVRPVEARPQTALAVRTERPAQARRTDEGQRAREAQPVEARAETLLAPWAERQPPARRTEEARRAREAQPVEAKPEAPAAGAKAVPEPPAAQPSPGLFRAEALKHRLSSEEGRGLVRVSPPWTWALLWVVLAGVAASVVASFVGEFEVTGRARGILRPTVGVRVLTSQMTGTVVRVEAHSGQRVKAGATLLQIDSATAQGQLLEAERTLDSVRTRFSATASLQDRSYEQQIEALRARAGRLGAQIASLRGSEHHFQRRVGADNELLRKGIVSELAVSDSRDALAQAQRQLNGAEQALDQTRQELAALESHRQDELWQRQQTVSAAQNKRDALALVMKQSVIQAPEDGTVESLLVRVGETVQAGQAVGKIVPVDSPLHVVSFLEEKDRAFVKPGDEVQLELDQLPPAEYGTLKARVVRIGDDLASAAEVQDSLGDGQRLAAPAYRVELEITDAHAAEAAGVKLRTGALLNARFTLRRQRLATLILKPLRKWFN